MSAGGQVENFLALAINFCLATPIRIADHSIGVSHIEPIAHEQHTVGHIQTSQKNLTDIELAVLVGITKQSDPID